jgi:phosphopantothenoylcysteine decarboxylase/phosphopantothenate--cysteine ligase
MIAANKVGPGCGFDKETNSLEVFWTGGGTVIGEDSKRNVARELIGIVAERYRASRVGRAGRETATAVR